LKSEVSYSGKDSYPKEKAHDKKKEEVKPKISGEKKMFQQKYLGFTRV